MNEIDQIHLEFQYSRKHSFQLIVDEIPEMESLIDSLGLKVNDYLYVEHKTATGRVWNTKNTRIKNCVPKADGREIVEIILHQSFGMQGIIQELISKLLSSDLVVGNIEDKVNIWADLLGICEDSLFTLERVEETDVEGNIHTNVYWTSLFNVSDSLAEELDSKHYIPPFLIEPKQWESIDEGGYYTLNEKAILGHRANIHEGNIALDVLNILQSYEWVLDDEITSLEELPNKDLEGDDLKAFLIQRNQSKKLYAEYAGRKFHWLYKFDKRGRIYTVGYHINLQSYGFKKASISLPEAFTITGTI